MIFLLIVSNIMVCSLYCNINLTLYRSGPTCWSNLYFFFVRILVILDLDLFASVLVYCFNSFICLASSNQSHSMFLPN